MFRRYTNLIFPFLMGMLALALALTVSQSTTTAHAATITVNSTLDVVADDGQCTLREAITAANSDSASGAMTGECPAGSGDDTIILSAETYLLTLEGAEENNNATGDLDLISNITIEVGSGTATLDGNQLDRVLHLHDGAIVSISDVTITGGKTADGIDGEAGEPGGNADHGGGIYNAGVLSLINSTVYSNTTGDGGEGGERAEGDWGDGGDGGDAGDGGGIYNASFAQLTIINSHISNNLTGEGGNGGGGYGYHYGGNGGKAGDGAAIYNATSASLTIRQSTLNANMTGQGGRAASDDLFSPAGFGGAGGAGGHGSGIFNAGSLTLSESSIEGNSTGEGGKGGDCFYDGSPGDGAHGGFGAGIYNIGLLSLTESSISYNTTGAGGDGGDGLEYNDLFMDSCGNGDGGIGGDGSGIYNGKAGEITISSSIIAENSTGEGGNGGNGSDGEAYGGMGGMGGSGAGIYNASTLTLLESTISDNTTGYGGDSSSGGDTGKGGDGGGIYNSGSLTLTFISLISNRTGNGGDGRSSASFGAANGGHGGQGGAIYNAESADFMMSDSTIMHNMTGDGGMGGSITGEDFFLNPGFGGNGGDGSGIFNHGTASLTNSTVSHNLTGSADTGGYGAGISTAPSGKAGSGGGIANQGSMTLANSTISDNITNDGLQGASAGNGGGITNGGTLMLNDSLVNQNRTGKGGDGLFEQGTPAPGGFGGGIHNTGVFTMTSSTISGNLTGDGGVDAGTFLDANGGFGGGLYNEGSMSIAESTIRDNQTGNGGHGTTQGGDGGDGAGIYHTGADFLNISKSTISHNLTGNGGDIPFYMDELLPLTPSNEPAIISQEGVENCDYLSEFNRNGGCGGDGAGIYHAGEGTVTLFESTISDNITGNGGHTLENEGEGGRGGEGGGIAHKGNGSLILLTSTVSGNSTGNGGNGKANEDGGRGGNGGGLFSRSSLTITHSTIANNSTGTGGLGGEGGTDGINGNGGGIANLAGNVSLKNSILAENNSSTGAECVGILSSEGYNLIQDTTDCEVIGDMTGNLSDMAAHLAPLADYGGSLFTHALLIDSPALDAGSCSDSSTDQRHRPRPIDAPSLPNADDGCDMGAYEAQVIDFHLTKSADDTTPLAGQLISYTITVSNLGVISTTTDALISDTLPTTVTFAGAVTLSPPQAGAILAQEASDLPTLASNVVISAGMSITLTLPVTVSDDISPGTSLTNIASVSSSEVSTATYGAVTIRVPAPELKLEQTLNTNGPFLEALPGQPLTYLLTFSNIGNADATNVSLSDIIPDSLTNISIISSGAAITDTGASPAYLWQVADLAPGAGGMISITGVISPEISSDLNLINQATITGTDDIIAANNQSQSELTLKVPRVQWNSSTVNVPEDGTMSKLYIYLDRSNPYSDVTVSYATSAGTASAGEDYTPISGTLIIPDSLMLTLPILDDKLTEGDETINLTLSNPIGGALGTPESAILTIIDNEATPTPTNTPTATNTPPATNTPSVTNTPTLTPTTSVTPEGAMDKLYLPLLLKE